MSTPHPNRPAGKEGPLSANWQLTTARPWSLMKLTKDINSMFPAGSIVALSNEIVVDSDSTPTKYVGQGPKNPETRVRVKVYIWRKDVTDIPHPSWPGGKPHSIPHKHLVDPITKTRRSRGSWGLRTQVMVSIPPTDGKITYMTAKYPVNGPRPGISYPIPDGTIGVITSCMTGTDRPITVAQQQSSSRSDWWYVVHFNLHKTEWMWTRCQEYVGVLALVPASPEEEAYIDELVRRTSGPATIVVVSKMNQ